MTQINEISPAMAPGPQAKIFPVEGKGLDRILSDPEHRRLFHHQLKQSNPFVVAFYRISLLSLFGMNRTVMLLTTRGNKSGKLRSTPIGYFKIGGVIHLFSAWGKGTAWYKNMIAHPEEVWIQIGMVKRPVNAQPLVDPAEILRTIEQFTVESPSQAAYLFGWEPGRDRMEDSDFSRVIDRVLIVRFVDKNA
jgi:deazaflavin-dependent oxidoreductase (nitroreductase family)